jgi:pyridoxal phosphate enzyme (YggS family)
MTFSIADKLENVRARIQKTTIAVKRMPNSVQLLGISKKHTAECLYEAVKCGLWAFGENYLNEALAKQISLKNLCTEAEYASVVWHFTGPIQSNKTRLIAENFAWVHTLERSKIVQRLNEQRPLNLTPLNCCIQVNIDEEDSKSGVFLEDIEILAEEINLAPNLCFRGLMCIPNADQSERNLKQAFQRMTEKFAALRLVYPSVDTLSMGMSGDIETAIECGSTMVRVGTAIFGGRA